MVFDKQFEDAFNGKVGQLSRWRLDRGLSANAPTSPTFWGISDQAVVYVTVTSAAVHPTRLSVGWICPFHQLHFTPHDIAQLDEKTVVVGGASGKDVALMLLEWVRPG